jgi:2-C-methyl-D-erythritol 4-phosphate cytidylyltransferase
MPSNLVPPRFHALVPCAGTGSRAGTPHPKQYQNLYGQPLVMHTLQALARVPQLSSGWVILSPGDAFEWPQTDWPPTFRREFCGGDTRAATVFNGLSAMLQAGVPADDWVLVHDAARCLITPDAVSQLIESCRDDDVGGLLALPLPDTLKSQTPSWQGHGAARVASTVQHIMSYLMPLRRLQPVQPRWLCLFNLLIILFLIIKTILQLPYMRHI